MAAVPGDSKAKIIKAMRDSLARTMPMRLSFNSRRYMLFYGFLGILCFVRTIESASLEKRSESSSEGLTGTLSLGLQSKKGQKEEVGNPSEIAYQAWLLIDGHPDAQQLGGFDSASLLRRIKPKSIFVAPNLTACPEGYQDDTMNRCVKDVNIDHQAHKGFIVQRLQAIFGSKTHAAASSSSSSSSSSSKPSGPFQLNIPFVINPPVTPTRDKTNVYQENIKKVTTEPPKNVDESYSIKDKVDNRHQDAIVTVYELNEDESKFFLGNKSTGNSQNNSKSPSTISDLDIPVAELVDNADTNLSGVIDYRITDDNSQNLTSINVDHLKSYDQTPTNVGENDKATDISPTLVLLLSPTKPPSGPITNSDLVISHNSSLGQVVIKMENSTIDASTEIMRVSVPETVVTSSSFSEPIPYSGEDSTTDSGTTVDFNDDESSDSTNAYYEDNYEESTEAEEEILRHSEAGMTVTLSPYGERTTQKLSVTDKEPTGSSEISSEVSINGDFVRETTLVDFNEDKIPNSTISSLTDDSEGLEEIAKDMEPDEVSSADDSSSEKHNNEQTSKSENTWFDDYRVKKPTSVNITDEVLPLKAPIVVLPNRPIDDDLEEPIQGVTKSTEKTDSAETMVASSTNNAGTILSREETKFDLPLLASKKRTGQPFRFEATTRIPTRPVSTISNIGGLYDYDPSDYPRKNSYGLPEDDEAPVIRTIDEQRYPSPQTEQEDQNLFGPQQQPDFVRFPSYDRHGRPNYVRFPSEEANSIHLNDYKERRPAYNQYQQEYNHRRGSSATRNVSGLDNQQKQSYRWLRPGWRMDKQHQQANQQRSKSNTELSRTPMLLRFWTRMPLVRDPSLNYQQPTYPSPEITRDSGSARRVNYYREMLSQDLNRAVSRKSLPSKVGG